MPLYIVLANYTETGVRTIKEAPGRMRELEETYQVEGFRMHGFYWTMGDYDVVSIVEAPDAEAMMTALAAVGIQGNVKTKTLRAFSIDEIEAITDRLP